ENYQDWSYDHGPGDDHEFIGGRFDLDKSGNYTITVSLLMGFRTTLLMSPETPVIVDSYTGTLCTIGPAPPPVEPTAAPPPVEPTVRYSLSTSVALQFIPGKGGSVEPSSGSTEPGGQIILIAYPSPGNEFSHWSGDARGTVDVTTVVLDSDKHVVANFILTLEEYLAKRARVVAKELTRENVAEWAEYEPARLYALAGGYGVTVDE
ncbi:hypothetical protein LCGC14_1361550, partial [marine sediment metagenome]